MEAPALEVWCKNVLVCIPTARERSLGKILCEGCFRRGKEAFQAACSFQRESYYMAG